MSACAGNRLVFLQILMAAAEEQGFAAAAHTNISLSAVSRRIALFRANG
jgi:DNA-binding transcriptional LysR family regulator